MAYSLRQYVADRDKEKAEQTERKGLREYAAGNDGTSSGNGAVQFGSLREYQKVKDLSTIVNQWITAGDSYLQGHNDRFVGRDNSVYVGDSGSWYDSSASQYDALKTQGDEILAILDKYGDYYDQAWVSSVREAISGNQAVYDEVLQAAETDRDYWALFDPDEEQKAAGYTAERLFNEYNWYQKNNGADYDTLMEKVASLPEGAEKTWLTGYANSIKTTADYQKEYDAANNAYEMAKIQYESADRHWNEWLAKSQEHAQNNAYLPGDGSLEAAEGEHINSEVEFALSQTKQRKAEYDAAKKAREDAQNALDSSKKRDEEEAELQAATEPYLPLMENADFDQYAMPDKNVTSENYVYLNMSPADRARYLSNKAYEDAQAGDETGDSAMVRRFEKLDRLEAEETKLYTYLYNTQGEAAAEAFLKDMETVLKTREYNKMTQAYAKYAQENPWRANAVAVLTSPAAGLDYVKMGLDYLATGDIDQRDYADSVTYRNSVIRSVSTQNINEKYGEFAADLYGWGTSTADFVSATTFATLATFGLGTGATAALSLAVMGTNAASNTTMNLLQSGVSDGMAFTMGTAAGVIEVLTEKCGIDALFDKTLLKAGLTGYLLKNGYSEMTEEAISSLANDITEIFLLSDKSTVLQEVEEYGLAQAITNIVLRAGASGIGGFASGIFVGSGSAALTSVSNFINTVDVGKQFAGSQVGFDTLKQLAAEEMQGNASVQAKSQIQKYADTVSAEKATGKGLGGKISAGMQNYVNAFRTGQLFNSVASSYAEQNQSDITKRLVESGYSEKAAGDIADALIAQAQGAELSHDQKKLLKKEGSKEAVKAVVSEIIENADSDMNQRKATMDILKTVVTVDNAAKKIEADARKTAKKETAKTSNNGATVSADGDTVAVVETKETDNRGLARTEQVTQAAQKDGRVATVADYAAAYGDHSAAMVQVYEMEGSSQGAEQFARGYEVAYNWGYSGVRSSYLTREDTREYTGILTEAQRQKAYENGREAAKADNKTPGNTNKVIGKNRENWRKGGVSAVGKNSDGGDLTMEYIDKAFGETVRGTVVNYLRTFAEITGIDVVLYESHMVDDQLVGPVIKDGELTVDLQNSEGGFCWNNNKIYLDLNAGFTNDMTLSEVAKNMMLYTFGHEFVHFCEKWNAEEYIQFREFVFERMDEKLAKDYADGKAQYRNMQELIEARMEEEGKDYDYCAREVLADSLAQMLPDSNFAQELARENMTWVEQIIDMLKKFIADIKAALKGIDPVENAPHVDIRENIDGTLQYLEEIRQMYDKLAAGAVQNYQAAMEAETQKNTTQEGSVSRKARHAGYDYSKSFAEQVDDYKTGKIPKADSLIVGGTPEVFKQIGFNALPMTINTTHVDYALYGMKDADHQLGEALLKQLPDKIKSPIAVFTSQTQTGTSVVALLPFTVNGKQIVAPIAVDGFSRQNGIRIDSNSITSIFGKTNAVTKLLYDAMVDESNGKFSLLYMNKKEAVTLLQRAGLQLPSGLKHHDGFIHSIRESGSPVNMKFQDVTETQQFRRWFGDWMKHPNKASKIVNADGTPKVMYHGSPAQFTIFDKKKAKSSGHYGRGFYFTDSQAHAGTYGQQYSVYLNIRNPLEYGRGQVNITQVHKFLEAVAENEDYSIENYGGYDVDVIVRNIMGKGAKMDAFQLIQDVNVTAIGDMVEAVELFNKVNGTQYDGIVAATETVAFYPEQIKSATDNIGIFDGTNADIRYKRKRQNVSRPVKVSELDIERKLVAHNDLPAIESAISATAQDLVAKGQTVTITPEEVSGHIQIAKATEISTARSLLKNILRQFLGKSVYFNHHGNYAEAYLTKDGLNHSAGGKITPERAAVVEKFNELVSKSEYSYSSKNDVHSRINQRIQGGIDWDCFVAVAMVDDAPYPIVFKIRTTTLDPRSQIYEIFAKKEIGSSHDGIQQENLPDALSNYGGTPISDTTITQPETNVKAETETKISNKKRGTTLSDREVLEVAALRMDTSTLTEGEQTALNIFKERLAKLRELQIERERLGSLWHELQFGSGDRSEAPKTLNRMKVLDGQIERAVNSVLSVEDKQVLRDVLQKAREYVKEQSVDHYRGILERRKDRSTQAQLRQKLHSTVHELSQLLLHGDKNHHVPESMKKAVAEALDVINSLDARKTAAQIAAIDGKIMELLQQKQAITQALTDENAEELSKKLLSLEGEIQQLQKRKDSAGRLQDKLAALSTAYAEIGKGADPDFVYAYDITVANAIQGAVEKIGDTDLKDMSTEQLESLCNAYKMLRAAVRNSNKSFTQGRNASVDAMIRSTINEVKKVGGVHESLPAVTAGVRQYLWNNLKPIYAMEKIGSDTFTDVFWSLIEGEGVYAGDVADASRFTEELQDKYGYKKWDFKKKYSFTSTAGTEFDLTLEQIMSLYAYAKRGDQALEHLRLGGFVFDNSIETYKEKDGKKSVLKHRVNVAKAHQLSAEIVGEIVAVLDDMPDVKSFVDEMQAYLSDTMGAKGNEVSMAMYDVELFKEKFYFPLKSAKQYMYEQNEVAGEVRIKNSGFTNKLTPGANNPVILNNFMDVWANHVHDMSMYHSFVLPIEDFNRIFNGKTRQAEGIEAVSVKATLQEAYGPEAVNYLKQLITDLNGGARSDPRESTGKALMSRFKKAAVMGSASVVIQQPSAMIRARALIDEKYFNHINPKLLSHGKLWAELKQYAPVAVIKEMGRFDMDTGRGTVDYIKNEKTLMDKVDDVLSVAPAKADEWAWIQIWEAVKRETAVKNPTMKTGSEEFLQKAGRRFTEVIVKTQVYDSTLSRSANMRSKSALMNMVTAFMAEPTTSINMLEQGMREWQRGNKKAASRHFTAVYGSVILNSLLVSIVYAMRDDDEDETFLEKYFSSVTTELIDGVNPLTYLPWVKDVWSILQGFDVERSDMSLVNDAGEALTTLVKALSQDTEDMSEEELAKHNKAVVEGWFGVAEVVTNFLGVPVKNVRRDAMGMINAITTLKTDFTERGLANWEYMKDQLGEAAKDGLPVVGWMSDKSVSDKMYDAIISGDDEYRARIEATYKRDTEAETKTAIKNAVRKALKENDPRITQMAEAYLNGNYDTVMDLYEEIHGEGHFVHDTIKAAYESRIGELEKKYGLTEEGTFTPDGDEADALFDAEAYYTAVTGGDNSGAEFVKSDMLEYMSEIDFNSKFRSTVKSHYEDGDLSGDEAKQMLTKHGGYSAQEAGEYVRYWDFQEEYPDLELSKAAVIKYYDGYYKDGKQVAKSAESYGISLDVYSEYCEKKSEYSKKEDIMDVIDELPLSKKQKDALYYLNGWAKSNIYDAPWH